MLFLQPIGHVGDGFAAFFVADSAELESAAARACISAARALQDALLPIAELHELAAEDVVVRLPVDWDSVDPIPPQLAEVLARPLPVELDLSDVVPGEPERVHQPVR